MRDTPTKRSAGRFAGVAFAGLALVAAACGDTTTTAASTTATPVTSRVTAATTVAPTAPSNSANASSTRAQATSTAAPAATPTTTAPANTIEVGYTGGTITGGGRRSTTLGQPVIIRVTSDVADELHLHGYDKTVELKANGTATITFIADRPGIFEVELEKKQLKLFELEVK